LKGVWGVGKRRIQRLKGAQMVAADKEGVEKPTSANQFRESWPHSGEFLSVKMDLSAEGEVTGTGA